MVKKYIWLLLFAIFIISCKKSDNTVASGKLYIATSYVVDGVPLVFDTIAFSNKAGNNYSVERLTYYLSDFRFYNNKKLVYRADSVFYFDARQPAAATLSYVPYGSYDSVAFNIGVDLMHNVVNGLPVTLANNEMIWPEPMGGGYHFIRLEGHWVQGANTWGYAVHLGQNAYLVMTGVKCALAVQANEQTLALEMNVNEWFDHPNTYNFNVDGVYTMGIDSLMRKIMQNGMDVFIAK